MYLQILNPIDSKTHVSPKEAERLVHQGKAAYVADGGKQRLYLLGDYEAMRLRAEIDNALQESEDSRPGEWFALPTGRRSIAGASTQRSMQFVRRRAG